MHFIARNYGISSFYNNFDIETAVIVTLFTVLMRSLLQPYCENKSESFESANSQETVGSQKKIRELNPDVVLENSNMVRDIFNKQEYISADDRICATSIESGT